MEKKIREEVDQGLRAVDCRDIAHYERLQAEVDLARLPAQEK